MKRILLIIPNIDFGGAQRSFIALAEALMEKYEVQVCTFNIEENILFRLPFEVTSLDVRGGRNLPDKVLMLWRRVKSLKKLKQQFRPEVSISYLEGSNYLNILTGKKDKVVISIRGSQTYDETISGLQGTFRKNVLMPMLYPKADAVVALNQGIKKELTGQYGVSGDKVKVIHNYYRLEDMRKAGREALPEPFSNVFARPCFVYAGRLAVEKGITELIQVFARVKKAAAHARLVIVGEGAMYNELISEAERTGLKVWHPAADNAMIEEADIVFTVYQANPYAFIQRARALLIASSSEGGPNILAESLILDTLVVSADCPDGPRERLAPGTGYARKLSVAEKAPNGWLMPMLKQENNEAAITEWTNLLIRLAEDPEAGSDQVRNAGLYMAQYDQPKLSEAWEAVI
ncbi:MAG: glycosyltransferase [Cyclobacteriaceae bacterium]